MASYVLKHSRTTINPTSTTYSTTTTLLTVAAGHLYIIKGLKQFQGIQTGGAITHIGSKLTISDNAGTNDAIFTPVPYVTSAGAITNAHLLYDWASTQTPQVFTNAELTQAIATDDTFTLRMDALKDMHLEAGQLLNHVPAGPDLATAWSVANSVNSSITWEISYIDYTL